jgi:hypothetical protein
MAGGVAGELEAVAGGVGELDDLVALVVVTQHDGLVTQRGASRPRPHDKPRVGGVRYDPGTDDAALGVRVGSSPEEQQRGGGGRGGQGT